jgi:hypothetical protein
VGRVWVNSRSDKHAWGCALTLLCCYPRGLPAAPVTQYLEECRISLLTGLKRHFRFKVRGRGQLLLLPPCRLQCCCH